MSIRDTEPPLFYLCFAVPVRYDTGAGCRLAWETLCIDVLRSYTEHTLKTSFNKDLNCGEILL